MIHTYIHQMNIFFLSSFFILHPVLGSCGFQWCGFHLCSVSKKSNYIWLMLIFIEFLHLCLKKDMSQIPNRHETKPSVYVLVDPGNPPWIRETPQRVQEPPHGSCLSLYLAHAYVLGSCYCIWLMLNIQAYITYLYFDFNHADLAHANFSQSEKTHEPRTCCIFFYHYLMQLFI